MFGKTAGVYTKHRFLENSFSQSSSCVGIEMAFDYELFWHLVGEATEETNQYYGKSLNSSATKISAIVPYGFELLDRPYPLWPRRHHPAIGYPSTLSRNQAECIGGFFQSILLDLLLQKYPLFYSRLKYVEIHRGGRYTRLDISQPLSPEVNTMHIELFPLPKASAHILDHYAIFVVCLFGAIAANNNDLPEIREFEFSKIRRNRLFQEYIMCEALMMQLDIGCPPINEIEGKLFSEIFKQLRIQSQSEAIRDIPFTIIEATSVEREICNVLIFERMVEMRKRLGQRFNHKGNEPILIESPSYYDDGKHFLKFSIGRSDLKKALMIIKKTYRPTM